MGYINSDSKSFHLMTRAGDLILLSLLWTLFSLPLITCGAATTALYYTMHKIRHDSGGGTFKLFWSGFKSNFMQATALWLFVIILAGLLGGDLILAYISTGSTSSIMFLAFAVFDCIAVTWTLYLFPYIARFEAKTGKVMKNSLILLTLNIGQSILLFGDFAAAIALLVCFYTMPLIPMFVPALYMMCANMVLEKVFARYMPAGDESENEDET